MAPPLSFANLIAPPRRRIDQIEGDNVCSAGGGGRKSSFACFATSVQTPHFGSGYAGLGYHPVAR